MQVNAKQLSRRLTVRAPRPAANPAYLIVDEEGRYVAHVEIHAHNHAADDAALFAAVPDLLEVARLLIAANCPEAVAFATQRAHAAIAQANRSGS